MTGRFAAFTVWGLAFGDAGSQERAYDVTTCFGPDQAKLNADALCRAAGYTRFLVRGVRERQPTRVEYFSYRLERWRNRHRFVSLHQPGIAP